MENISSRDELKNAIQVLEAEQAVHLLEMKKKFLLIYESMKPVNLIKNTFKDISSSPHLVTNLLGAAIWLATGFLSKKAVIGQSNSALRKVLAYAVQFGVSSLSVKYLKPLSRTASMFFSIFSGKKKQIIQEREG